MKMFDKEILHKILKYAYLKQNRSTEVCPKLKRTVDMTSSGMNGLIIRTNASPIWDRTTCQRLSHNMDGKLMRLYVFLFTMYYNKRNTFAKTSLLDALHQIHFIL